MGANEKYEAATHGVEYGAILDSSRLHYALSKDPGNGRTTEEWWAVKDETFKDFDRAIAKIRAEAKAEALNEAAISVMDERIESETEASNWLDTRANQYKEAPNA